MSVVLSACQGAPSAAAPGGSSTSGSERGSGASAPAPATPSTVLDVFPADLATGIAPNSPVTVRATSGTFGKVTLAGSKGEPVAGRMRPDGTWQSSDLLRPSSSYTLTVESPGPDGAMAAHTSTFATLKPDVTATYSLIPGDGTVGVGMPVIVQFSSAVVTKAQRAEVEKRVTVTTVPQQVGAWGWLDDRQLMWRPRSYWLPGTKVSVSTPLHGVQTGDGKWVSRDGSASFTVGSSMVSSVDMNAHRLMVRRNGELIRSFPVSTGMPGPLTETRFGTKVIMERSAVVVMDSSTVALPPGTKPYKISVKWDLKLTGTGEYIHSAPWSVGAQGHQNVSHGCTNMAPADAEWMFNHSRVGDIVKYTGSSREFRPSEGIGVWVYDFAGWKARSALVPA